MMRGTLTLLAFVSVMFFPWPLTATLALFSSLVEPLMPLAVGIFADTLYYTPHAGVMPIFTLAGALATFGALFVRSRLRTGIIKE
ncbi:MAG: hypothetical protein KGJ31_02215 [Patescibacteria group bacterium]|nr:hypothetical protein [Patescibacteria group bacterium]